MLLENYLEENVGADFIDLRIGEIYKFKSRKTVDWEKEELPEYERIALNKSYILKPGEYVLCRTIESVKMPADYIGIIFVRTKAYRIGLDVKCSRVDAGYEGELVMGLHNISNHSIVIRKGYSFFALMVADLRGNTVPIASRFMYGKVM